ncbi:MAG: hypothetical protein QOJ57_2729 [Thermoleophilaceae bacterium]|nr:hypothetical protein [Thermoleophilaceae bacterium]
MALAGCGGAGAERLPTRAPSLGPTQEHRPQSLGKRAARGEPVRGLRCARADPPRYGVHLELFAGRRVVLVAPGIGIAPPRTRDGAYVRGGRCSYPLRTREPTGVVEVEAGGRPKTLGDLFAIWGQPLSRKRMAGFEGRVRAYVAGRRWHRDPRAIPLTRHAQIVLEVGGYVKPHATYHFPPGL